MILENGSTKLTLKNSFLEKSSLGDHTITFVYDGAEVETKLTIAEKEEEPKADEATTEKPKTEEKEANPQTGDNIMIYVCTLVISVIGITSAVVLTNKKKLFSNN